jgi:aspartate aminotransferase-like enzyme
MSKLLMIPGPTTLSDRVRAALQTPMRAHRTEEFGEFLYNLREDVKKVFQTRNDLHVLSGSSTAGMDAAVSSWLSPGDKVIVPVYGKFSARFRTIVQAFGGEVVELQLPWGEAPILRQIQSVYTDDIKAVLVVQNETSTGVRIELDDVGDFMSSKDALLIVDAVSSMGGDDIPTDEWGVDLCVAGTQKAFGCPPGLAMVSVSDKAWDVMDRTHPQSFYLDLRRYRSSDKKKRGQTPFTQGETLLFGLRAALDEVLEEGIARRFARHRQMGEMARAKVESLGLDMFPALEGTYSNTLTAIRIPKPLSATEIQRVMNERHDVIVATGHDDYKEKMIRIAHLGSTTSGDLARTLDAFEDALAAVRG